MKTKRELLDKLLVKEHGYTTDDVLDGIMEIFESGESDSSLSSRVQELEEKQKDFELKLAKLDRRLG